jgi:hypothetical protein
MPRPMHPDRVYSLVQRRHRMVGVGRLVSGRPRGERWLRVVVKVAHVGPMLWEESDVFKRSPDCLKAMVAAFSERSYGFSDAIESDDGTDGPFPMHC